jgi:MFS family permease
VATFGGFGVDAFNYTVYTFLIPTLMTTWHMSTSQAGLVATGSLVFSALGGWLAGILADRYGRVRILQVTIVWFSVFTVLNGFTHSFEMLMFTRTMQGLGFGGEWSVGSVLLAETIRPEHRGKAVGIMQSSWAVGWGLAAITYAAVYSILPETAAWRVLFWAGILPGVLVWWLCRNLQEPPVYIEIRRKVESGESPSHFLRIFVLPILKITILASLLCMGMQGGYYSVTTWLPTYLRTVRNFTVSNAGGYLVVIITGSFIGYVTAALIIDRLGRRRTFILFAVAAATMVTAYMLVPVPDKVLLLLGLPLGFAVSGVFSGAGSFLSELYPNDIRGSGQGFCYNFGRAAGSLFPTLIGFLSLRMGLGRAMGIFAVVAYGLLVISAFCLPETKGKDLITVGPGA